jgi:hypothetical protein
VHALPHAPQFASDVVVSTQAFPHIVDPLPHAHVVPVQTRPLMHGAGAASALQHDIPSVPQPDPGRSGSQLSVHPPSNAATRAA